MCCKYSIYHIVDKILLFSDFNKEWFLLQLLQMCSEICNPCAGSSACNIWKKNLQHNVSQEPARQRNVQNIGNHLFIK